MSVMRHKYYRIFTIPYSRRTKFGSIAIELNRTRGTFSSIAIELIWKDLVSALWRGAISVSSSLLKFNIEKYCPISCRLKLSGQYEGHDCFSMTGRRFQSSFRGLSCFFFWNQFMNYTV